MRLHQYNQYTEIYQSIGWTNSFVGFFLLENFSNNPQYRGLAVIDAHVSESTLRQSPGVMNVFGNHY